MQKFIMCRGLPGSGKSTWANSLVDKDIGYRVVNKDKIRAELGGKWSKTQEKQTIEIRNERLRFYLDNGFSVISDDTNFAPVHEQYFRSLAAEYNADFQIQDFTNVDFHTCIERDLKREASVGKEIIYSMYRKYLQVKEPEFNPDLATCVIVDVDGTVAEMGDRHAFAWDKVGQDKPISSIIELVKCLSKKYHIYFVSGRDGICEEQTQAWLKKYFDFPFLLFMRGVGDNRKDYVVKKEIYLTKLKDQVNIAMVIDDRFQTVQVWRELGLKTLQVDWGYF